jgi:hypothetical protein
MVGNDTWFYVGMQLRTPDTAAGTICQINEAEGTLYVMWGDNNRKQYAFGEARSFPIVGNRQFQVFINGDNRWIESGTRGDFTGTLDVYRATQRRYTYVKLAEVNFNGDTIRWVSDDEISREVPR